jgi:hypothetical protein
LDGLENTIKFYQFILRIPQGRNEMKGKKRLSEKNKNKIRSTKKENREKKIQKTIKLLALPQSYFLGHPLCFPLPSQLQ